MISSESEEVTKEKEDAFQKFKDKNIVKNKETNTKRNGVCQGEITETCLLLLRSVLKNVQCINFWQCSEDFKTVLRSISSDVFEKNLAGS